MAFKDVSRFFPAAILLSFLLSGCAKLTQNVAEYNAQVKARQPKAKTIERSVPKPVFKLVEVFAPVSELKVVYRTNDELIRSLETRQRYKELNDDGKSIERKMIPIGGLIKVMDKHFEGGNEYTVDLFSHTRRIGSCSNDVSGNLWKEYDPDVEIAVRYSAPVSPGGMVVGHPQPNIKVECPVNVPNPDTLFIHVLKNGSKYAVYRLNVL